MQIQVRPVQVRGTSATLVAALLCVPLALLGAPASADAAAHPSGAAPDTSPASVVWGPVSTLWHHGYLDLAMAATDGGTSVAAWVDRPTQELWLATRTAGGQWSAPVDGGQTADAIRATSTGDAVWVLGQNASEVVVRAVAADGTVGPATSLGPSSASSILDAKMAGGPNGSVVAAWHETAAPGSLVVADRPAGGAWSAPVAVPVGGGLRGLVPGPAGGLQLVLSTHRGTVGRLTYLRRTSGGSWLSPVVLAQANVPTDEVWPTVASGDARGDVVVAWPSNGSYLARYRSGAGVLGQPYQLTDAGPYGSTPRVAIEPSGVAIAAYPVLPSGEDPQTYLNLTTSQGVWGAAQALPLHDFKAPITMNAAGDFVVTAQFYQDPLTLVKCSAAGACGPRQTDTADTPYVSQATGVTYGPDHTIRLLWGRGCGGEGCRQTSIVTQQGTSQPG